MAELERDLAKHFLAEAEKLEGLGDIKEATRLRNIATEAIKNAGKYDAEAAALIAEIKKRSD